MSGAPLAGLLSQAIGERNAARADLEHAQRIIERQEAEHNDLAERFEATRRLLARIAESAAEEHVRELARAGLRCALVVERGTTADVDEPAQVPS